MEKKFKPLNILVMWLLTLGIGFFMVLVINAQFDLALLTTFVAAVASLPYLAVMAIVGKDFTNFWKFQVVHLIFATATAYVIYVIDEDFISFFFWLPWCYFVLGAVIQAYFWFKKENKIENDAK